MTAQPEIRKDYAFVGEWMPDHDPLTIGENNFAELQNFRYINSGIEPIEGYTEINTTSLKRLNPPPLGFQN